MYKLEIQITKYIWSYILLVVFIDLFVLTEIPKVKFAIYKSFLNNNRVLSTPEQ